MSDPATNTSGNAKADTPLIVWTDRRHAETVGLLIAKLADRLETIAIGGARAAAGHAVFENQAAPRYDDLRKMLVDHPNAHVLLADEEGVSLDDLVLASKPTPETTRPIALLEPATDGLAEAALLAKKLGPEPSHGPINLLPAFDHAPGWYAAADPAETLGPIESVGMISLGAAGGQSLFARLFDAWRVVLSIGQTPESIDASLTGPLGDVPDSLRALTGHLAIHARIDRARAAVLQVSDRAGPTTRTLHAVGERARLRVDDQSYALHTIEGTPIDATPTPTHSHSRTLPPQEATPTADAVSPLSDSSQRFVELAAIHWRRLLDNRAASSVATPAGPTGDTRAILSCCAATLLSARTGQPESPERMLAMRH